MKIKAEDVLAVFKDKNNKILFKLFNIDEIVKSMGLAMPKTYAEALVLKNRIRQGLYAAAEIEFRTEARTILRIKIKKQPVAYGFSKVVDYIVNNCNRFEKRYLRASDKFKEIKALSVSMLPQNKKKLLLSAK